MQAMPPETMENSVEVKLATTPDSTSPRRGPPVTTAIWIDEIRLRYSSVMAFCRIVLRRTVEMTSIAPATARQMRPTTTTWTSPKSVIAAPHAMTTNATSRP